MLGSFDIRVFPTSKQVLEKKIDQLFQEHPGYKIPDKWKTYDSWSQRGFDFLETRIFYLSGEPEEMYYVSFIGDSVMLANPNQIGIAIRAVHNASSKRWLLEKDFDKAQKERIESRFDKEIIAKIEASTGVKSKRED